MRGRAEGLLEGCWGVTGTLEVLGTHSSEAQGAGGTRPQAAARAPLPWGVLPSCPAISCVPELPTCCQRVVGRSANNSLSVTLYPPPRPTAPTESGSQARMQGVRGRAAQVTVRWPVWRPHLEENSRNSSNHHQSSSQSVQSCPLRSPPAGWIPLRHGNSREMKRRDGLNDSQRRGKTETP